MNVFCVVTCMYWVLFALVLHQVAVGAHQYLPCAVIVGAHAVDVHLACGDGA